MHIEAPIPYVQYRAGALQTFRFTVFAIMALSHRFWHMELESDSHSSQSFITPEGSFSPTRVLHGTTNAATHPQSALAEALPGNLKRKMLVWLDDILLHAQTESGLTYAVEQILQFCA